MRIFLINNGIDIIATQEDKYSFVIDIASGKSSHQEITEWLINHSKEKSNVS